MTGGDAVSDSVLDLPHLASIFEALRRGRHLCARDGDVFHCLKRQEPLYEALFDRLGFTLVHHARDFYYFFDSSNFTDLTARMAVFMFILVEALADQGEPVEETVTTRRFSCEALPHLENERYQGYMREAGITSAEELAQIVRTMERFGFTRRFDEQAFEFAPPVYRFLDLCMDMAGEAAAATTGEGGDAAGAGAAELDDEVLS